MNSSAQSSTLWESIFGTERFTGNATERDRFRVALESARIAADQLASEISRDLPQYTQHDLSHLDALWHLAGELIGPDIELNPAEGFVLGVAFLVHDLGMSHAAYEVTGQSIREDHRWPDALGAELRKINGRAPSAQDLAEAPTSVLESVERELLRELHAEQASRLPSAHWKRLDGSTEYLIEDSQLRSSFAELIGRIASSHHWDTSIVESELDARFGAPAFAPVAWTTDSLTLAYLLRAADAIHLDASRSPDVLAASRNIAGVSAEHWSFQSKLQRPFVNDARLAFSSSTSFGQDEINSWWLAFDMIRLVDTELLAIDRSLQRLGRPRFRVMGVSGVESPRSLSEWIKCNGWEPVDARTQVSDIAALVRSLGGKALYGDQPHIGLRELLLNATDAIRANEALAEYKGRLAPHSRIDVSLRKELDEVILSVTDNGIGMTATTMTTSLLDFGQSSWLSQSVVGENPGLAASRFEPSGRYGIGFFACFMLGSRVRVASRSRFSPSSETWVLEFGDSLSSRATVRRATNSENLDEAGTRVEIILDKELVESDRVDFRLRGLPSRRDGFTPDLPTVISSICPASGVDIWAHQFGASELAVGKDDWKSLSGGDLISRIAGVSDNLDEFVWDNGISQDKYAELYEFANTSLTTIVDDEGREIARLALIRPGLGIPHYQGVRTSIITTGPCASSTSFNGLIGLAVGSPRKAARDLALPIWPTATFHHFLDGEVRNLARGLDNVGGEGLVELATGLTEEGINVSDLRIWQTAAGWLTSDELATHLQAFDQITIVSSLYTTVRRGIEKVHVSLESGVIVTDSSRNSLVVGEGYWPTHTGPFYSVGVTAELLKIIARVWAYPIDVLLDSYEMDDLSDTGGREIGSIDGEVVRARAVLVKRPVDQ